MKKFGTMILSALMMIFVLSGIARADEMTINGQVMMGQQGQPAPGVPVMAFLPNDSIMADAMTDETGFFEIILQAPDGYQGEVMTQVFDWCTMNTLEEVFPFINGEMLTVVFHICQEGGGGGTQCHANFHWQPLEGLQIAFEDDSWGDEIDEWSWDFGDGTTGTGEDIVHLFAEPGLYPVTLTISGGQCSDERTKMVHVMDSIPPQPGCQAMFGYEPEEGLTIQFIDLSMGEDIDEYLWDFGDGTISDDQEPEHTFAEQGMYLVSLTIAGEECNSSIEMPVHVMDSVWPPQGCHANFHWEMMDNLTVQFFNASQGEDIDEYLWDFGDGSFSDEMDPLHVFPEEGMYEVSLTIFGDDCQDMKVKNVHVHAYQPPQGCQAMFFYEFTEDPFTLAFIDLSMGDINAWNWNFGDSTTSVEQNPYHTYAEEGMYMVSLEVTGDSCNSIIEMPVFVGDSIWPPQNCHANFHWNIVGDLTVQFEDVSQGEDITEWMWDFGNGEVSYEQNPTYTYSEEGNYEVSLTISGTECQDTKTKRVNVGNNWPPQNCHADYDWNVLEDGLTVEFFDMSVSDSITEYMWDFGDGDVSAEQNPVHTYAEEGMYFVALTIVSDECTDTRVRHIHVGEGGGWPPQNCHAMFFPEYISDMTIAFTDMSMGNIDSWFWNFGDNNTSAEQNPQHTYAEAGIYIVTLAISGEECADSLAMEIFVDEPWNNNPCEALFLPEFTENPLEVMFHDMSIGAVSSWSWNFGDGTASYEQNPSHTYEQSGTYLVTLGIETEDGCSHVYSVEVNLETMSYSALHSSTGSTGINEVLNISSLNLYPNPVDKVMNITFNAEENETMYLVITSALGQQIYKASYSAKAASNHIEVNTSDFEKGLYIMQLHSADGSVATQKFIK